MKIEMSGMPSSPYEIIVKGDKAFIRFYENTEEIPAEERPRWVCDMYQLEVRNRPGLEASIQSGYEKWLNAAKAQEGFTPIPATEERVGMLEEEMDGIVTVLEGIV